MIGEKPPTFISAVLDLRQSLATVTSLTGGSTRQSM